MNYFTSKTAEQLTLVSISHAREGKAGELKKACLDLIEKTRQEEGAISYHLYEDRFTTLGTFGSSESRDSPGFVGIVRL